MYHTELVITAGATTNLESNINNSEILIGFIVCYQEGFIYLKHFDHVDQVDASFECDISDNQI